MGDDASRSFRSTDVLGRRASVERHASKPKRAVRSLGYARRQDSNTVAARIVTPAKPSCGGPTAATTFLQGVNA